MKKIALLVIAGLFAITSAANATWIVAKEPTGSTCDIQVQTWDDPQDNQSEYQGYNVIGSEYILSVSNQASTGDKGVIFVFDQAFQGTLIIEHTIIQASDDPNEDGVVQTITKQRAGLDVQAGHEEVFLTGATFSVDQLITGVSVITVQLSSAVGHFRVYQASLNHNGVTGIECGN